MCLEEGLSTRIDQNMNNTPFQLISTGSVNKQWRQSTTFRFCAAELWSQWKHTVATLCPPRHAPVPQPRDIRPAAGPGGCTASGHLPKVSAQSQ